MQRSRTILILALAGLGSFFIWKESDSGIAMILSVLLFGIALAQFYWSGFAGQILQTFTSSKYNVGLLALCCVVAFLILGAIDVALKPPSPTLADHGEPTALKVAWILALIGYLVPVSPLLLRGMRNRDISDIRAPLWPIIAGLGGGGALWIAGAFIWITLAQPALTAESPIDEIALFTMFGLSEAGLFGGIGAAIWWRAIDLRSAARFDNTGIFTDVIFATVASLGLAVLVVLSVTVRNLNAAAQLGNSGKAWCGILLALLGSAWMVALWRVRELEPVRSISAIFLVALLMIMFAIGFAIPSILVDAREWTSFVLLMVVPLTILAAGFILTTIPRMVRAILA